MSTVLSPSFLTCQSNTLVLFKSSFVNFFVFVCISGEVGDYMVAGHLGI